MSVRRSGNPRSARRTLDSRRCRAEPSRFDLSFLSEVLLSRGVGGPRHQRRNPQSNAIVRPFGTGYWGRLDRVTLLLRLSILRLCVIGTSFPKSFNLVNSSPLSRDGCLLSRKMRKEAGPCAKEVFFDHPREPTMGRSAIWYERQPRMEGRAGAVHYGLVQSLPIRRKESNCAGHVDCGSRQDVRTVNARLHGRKRRCDCARGA